jgi:hypothetical protein
MCSLVWPVCRAGTLFIGHELVQKVANSCTRARPQSLQGSYVLRAKLVAVVDSVLAVSGAVEGDITAAEALASYASIHPLYLQARPAGRRVPATHGRHLFIAHCYRCTIAENNLAARRRARTQPADLCRRRVRGAPCADRRAARR